MELCQSELGEDHPDTLLSMHNLAIQYSEAGRLVEALQLAEEVLELRKSKLGEDYPDTLASERLLAYLCRETEEHFSTQEVPHRPRRSKLKFLKWIRSDGDIGFRLKCLHRNSTRQAVPS